MGHYDDAYDEKYTKQIAHERLCNYNADVKILKQFNEIRIHTLCDAESIKSFETIVKKIKDRIKIYELEEEIKVLKKLK